MNRARTIELLPVITAFAEGRAIECKLKNSGDDWTAIDLHPIWASDCDYRIKPEAKTGWINIYPDYCRSSEIYKSNESARLGSGKERVACIEISYFEGEGL
jgi:hypothetical protein